MTTSSFCVDMKDSFVAAYTVGATVCRLGFLEKKNQENVGYQKTWKKEFDLTKPLLTELGSQFSSL